MSTKQFEADLDTNILNIHKELENAGDKFVRYADDFLVMTKTKEELPAALQ